MIKRLRIKFVCINMTIVTELALPVILRRLDFTGLLSREKTGEPCHQTELPSAWCSFFSRFDTVILEMP